MPRPNNRFYDLLEVSTKVEKRGLEVAYRRTADRLRRRGTEDDQRRLRDVEEAWSVLSDPHKRRLYDEHGEKAFEPDFQMPAAPMMAPSGPAAGGGAPPPMGGVGGPQGWAPPGAQEQGGWAAHGNAQPPPGWGHGHPPPGQPTPSTQKSTHVGPIEVWVPFKLSCIGGRQEVLVGDELHDVPITPGATSGMIVSYRGRQYVLQVEESDTFIRQGLDLHVTLIVEEHDAESGCEMTVPTLDKHMRIEIPSGTQDGDALRYEGLGVRVPGEIGDLVADFQLRADDLQVDRRRFTEVERRGQHAAGVERELAETL